MTYISNLGDVYFLTGRGHPSQPTCAALVYSHTQASLDPAKTLKMPQFLPNIMVILVEFYIYANLFNKQLQVGKQVGVPSTSISLIANDYFLKMSKFKCNRRNTKLNALNLSTFFFLAQILRFNMLSPFRFQMIPHIG